MGLFWDLLNTISLSGILFVKLKGFDFLKINQLGLNHI